MMLYPSIVELLEKAGSKYSLVIAVAKRAREICESGKDEESQVDGARGITKAATDVAEDNIKIINYEGRDELIEKAIQAVNEEISDLTSGDE